MFVNVKARMRAEGADLGAAINQAAIISSPITKEYVREEARGCRGGCSAWEEPSASDSLLPTGWLGRIQSDPLVASYNRLVFSIVSLNRPVAAQAARGDTSVFAMRRGSQISFGKGLAAVQRYCLSVKG